MLCLISKNKGQHDSTVDPFDDVRKTHIFNIGAGDSAMIKTMLVVSNEF